MSTQDHPGEATTGVGLDAEQLGRVFPFHLVFNRQMHLVQTGVSAGLICPGMAIGAQLEDFVSLSSPNVACTFEELSAHQNSLILFRTASGVTLRGQVVGVGPDLLSFVGSPWVTEPAVLEQVGLTLSDFALHDSVADYMFLLQAQKTALQDAKQLATRLQQIDEEKARLARAEQALALELNAFPDLALRMDRHGLLLEVRPAKETDLVVPRGELIGTSAYDGFPEMGPQLREALQRAFTFGKTQSFEYTMTTKKGEGYYEARVVRCSEEEALALVRDVSERHELQHQLLHQAFHDPLTGLANRALFEDRVGHALARTDRSRETLAVLFIDLDDFKIINDTMGHRVGDSLLTAVAERLAEYTRPRDTIARLGGDEFAVLLEAENTHPAAESVAHRLIEAFRSPFNAGGHRVSVTGSIGLAYATGGIQVDELLRNADMAMYAAKSAGKCRPAVFNPEMKDRLLAQVLIESELREAVDKDQFLVLYQPIIDVASGRVVSCEALVRWQHPTRGLLSPLEFISIAEQNGMIVPIGTLVLNKACQQAARWVAEMDGETISVSVNVSPRQLIDPGLVPACERALLDSGLDPSLLILEVTETALITDAERTTAVLKDLKRLGVQMALDDFGTGYSSLSHLHQFPIDSIKVDKSFIDGIPTDGSASTLAHAILDIGRILGVNVVAEGVESETQLDTLRSWGCPSYQGYIFAPPIEASAISTMLRFDQPTDRYNPLTSNYILQLGVGAR